MYRRTLDILTETFGPDDLSIAAPLSNLAELYYSQGRYADAEPLYQRALAINEKTFGSDEHAAQLLNNLVLLYINEGRYADALSLLQRLIPGNIARKEVALSTFLAAQSHGLISTDEASARSYDVFQRVSASSAAEAISKLAARFAARNDGLAQIVRRDQDLTAEAERLDRAIITAVSKKPAQRNAVAEAEIRKRLESIKSERNEVQNILNQRFPDYITLSKPQSLTVEETQSLLGDDEAVVVIDLIPKAKSMLIPKVMRG
jgi:tetratricopeptide (TPR) repeat protein